MQAGVTRRSSARTAAGVAGLAALTLAALIPGLAQPQADYVIGAKTFTEQYILAALIEQRLQAAGLTAERRPGLGSNVLFDALAKNEIDIAVDYSGTIWTNRMQRSRHAIADAGAGSNWRTGSAQNTIFACWARSDSRMPMRWR